MAKLTRCPAGHVYDREAHASCPECARTGVAERASGKAALGRESESAGTSGMPKSWLAIGGAGIVVLILAGLFLLKPTGENKVDTPSPPPPATAVDPKTDSDYGACAQEKSDQAACDRAIASAKFGGKDLGALYRYRAYAKSHAEKPDLDAAIADYSEAVRLDPNNFIPFILRANVYSDKGQRELAIKDYDRVIELNPRADFYNNRGDSLRKTGNVDRAIADLDEAIKLDPNYIGAYWNRGLAYQDKGDPARAADDYKKALSLNPSESARKQIEALLKEVTPEPASPPATSSQATPPQQTDAAKADTGNADTGKGKEPEPAPRSKVLKSSDEAYAEPDFKACKAMGTNQVADCDRAIASGKFEGAALAALYNNRGQARIINHDDGGALEDFDKAIELNPSASAPYNNRGVIYSDRKEYDRAIADFAKAIELNATKPFAFQGRGLAYWKKGDLEHAATDYKKALSLNPPDKLRQEMEQDLKEIEAGAKSTPGSEPAQKQGSDDTPPDDKNSALSGVREGGSSNASGLPSTTKPQEGQGSSLPVLPAAVATTVRPGVYRVSGINGRGDTFAGMAALAKDGDNFRLTVWNGAKILHATGQFADGILLMKYADKVRVTFRLNGDGSLEGKWDQADGSERFDPVAFSATTDMPLAEGVYSVASKQPDGKPISGTVKITKRGIGYHLEWTYDDGDKMDGWGKLSRNMLSLSAANNAGWDKDAAIVYALGPDGSLSGLYASGTGQEKLTPAGPGTTPSADNTPQNKPQAAADPKKDAEYCITTIGPDAMPACDRAIASGKFGTLDLGTLHGRRAVLHFANKNDEAAAIAEFSEAIRLDGSNASYFGNRAVLYSARDDYDKAIEDLDEAIRLAPAASSHYQNRGFAYLKKGDKNHARDDYNKALSLNPGAENKKEIEAALKDIGPDYRSEKLQ